MSLLTRTMKIRLFVAVSAILLFFFVIVLAGISFWKDTSIATLVKENIKILVALYAILDTLFYAWIKHDVELNLKGEL